MGVIERIGRAIALGDTPLHEPDLGLEAGRMLAVEAPWRDASDSRSIVSHLIGLGPIQPLVDDPDVSDVLANGPSDIWFDRGNGLEKSGLDFGSDEALVSAVERVLAPLGLRIDRMSPMVDARLADGSRLHAVLPPAAVDSPLLAIRRFTQRVSSLDDLVDEGTATSGQIERLVQAVVDKKTIVVSGQTGAGKTTLLNLLAGAIPAGERVVTVEDAAELALPGHVVRLEARAPNAEGVGGITIESLLRSALRLRPDRIILGEVRGAEAFELISALNTGHRGSMTTVHANSPSESLLRLETLALSRPGASEHAVTRQLLAAIDLVVQVGRQGVERRINSIADRRELDLDP